MYGWNARHGRVRDLEIEINSWLEKTQFLFVSSSISQVADIGFKRVCSSCVCSLCYVLWCELSIWCYTHSFFPWCNARLRPVKRRCVLVICVDTPSLDVDELLTNVGRAVEPMISREPSLLSNCTKRESTRRPKRCWTLSLHIQKSRTLLLQA